MVGHPNEKGEHENKDQNGTLEEGKFLNEESVETSEQPPRRLRLWWKKKYEIRAPFIYLFIFLLCALVVIFSVIATVLQKTSADSYPTCPLDWVGYRGRCYFFSDDERTWDFSQRNCTAYNASLTAVDFPWEMDLIMRFKRPADHWFGLRREDENHPWKWTNGSVFNNWFRIRANGPCAYLNDEGAASTWCHTPRNWICSKILHIP